eukprot:5437513-Lingulodinium_polyedra.AAC.1
MERAFGETARRRSDGMRSGTRCSEMRSGIGGGGIGGGGISGGGISGGGIVGGSIAGGIGG